MSEDKKKTPDWKSDFPIQRREAAYVSRKEFIKLLTLFSGTLAFANLCIPVVNYFRGKKVITDYFVCTVAEIAVGGMKTFYINGDHRNPYMLIRLAEDSWRVFEQKCTHLSCAVVYDHQNSVIECPCHHGFFDPKDGSVLQGPPPRDLPQLEVVIKEGTKIFVKTFEESV